MQGAGCEVNSCAGSAAQRKEHGRNEGDAVKMRRQIRASVDET